MRLNTQRTKIDGGIPSGGHGPSFVPVEAHRCRVGWWGGGGGGVGKRQNPLLLPLTLQPQLPRPAYTGDPGDGVSIGKGI